MTGAGWVRMHGTFCYHQPVGVDFADSRFRSGIFGGSKENEAETSHSALAGSPRENLAQEWAKSRAYRQELSQAMVDNPPGANTKSSGARPPAESGVAI